MIRTIEIIDYCNLYGLDYGDRFWVVYYKNGNIAFDCSHKRNSDTMQKHVKSGDIKAFKLGYVSKVTPVNITPVNNGHYISNNSGYVLSINIVD